MTHDHAFDFAASAVRAGMGLTREVGAELADRGLRHALVLTDPVVVRLAPAARAIDSLEAAGIRWVLYDRVSIEPTDRSFRQAIALAGDRSFDAASPSVAARRSTRRKRSTCTRRIPGRFPRLRERAESATRRLTFQRPWRERCRSSVSRNCLRVRRALTISRGMFAPAMTAW